MSTIKVRCYKGVGPDDRRDVDLDPASNLSAVRVKLVASGFIQPDTSDVQLRFVAAQSDSSEVTEALIVLSVERGVPLQFVLGSANQLILTNIAARKRPDLIGIGTTTFHNRYIGVEVFLNNEDPEGKKTNERIGAFPPMMLTNVKPTSTNVVGIYDNVCVCVEDSVVGFRLNSWGAVGFQMYVAPDAGEPIINDDLFIAYGDVPNHYATAGILRYAKRAQTIQIVGADTVGISSSQTLRFQKVVFRTRRMTSYKQGGRTYSSDEMPPRLTHAGGTRAETRRLTVVPGEAIKPGGPIEGPASNQTFGGSLSEVRTDDPANALGEVVVYFFVFKSHADAVAVINGYNAVDPSVWS